MDSLRCVLFWLWIATERNGIEILARWWWSKLTELQRNLRVAVDDDVYFDEGRLHSTGVDNVKNESPLSLLFTRQSNKLFIQGWLVLAASVFSAVGVRIQFVIVMNIIYTRCYRLQCQSLLHILAFNYIVTVQRQTTTRRRLLQRNWRRQQRRAMYTYFGIGCIALK